nr:leucine-rich repeat domain-containing protein [Lachnospiraceae bacterium]
RSTIDNGTWKYGCIFEGCTALKSITVPEGITSIPEYAFFGCNKLEELILPSTLTAVPGYLCYKCTALKELEILENVTAIGEYALAGCTSITELTIPSGVTAIGDYGLSGMTGLTELMINGNGLTTIGAYGFNGCTGLSEVNLPDSVTTITYRAFYNCTGLQSFHYPTGWTTAAESKIDSGTWKYGRIFEGCTALKRITIPAGITTVPVHAFSNCESIEEILLPSTLTSLPDYFCNGCTAIKELTIPSNVTAIGEYALYKCSGIRELTIPASVQEIKTYALGSMTGLLRLTISGTGLKTVGAYAFSEDSALASVLLPDSVEDISYHAFYNCTNLSSFHYPKGLTKSTQFSESGGWKYGNIFEGCTKLRKIRFSDEATAIPDYLFRSSPVLTSVILPGSMRSIGQYAFYNCGELGKAYIPANVTTIGTGAFQNDTLLTIYGSAGSTAASYASANNISFIAKTAAEAFRKLGGNVSDSFGTGIEGVSVLLYDLADNSVSDNVYTDAEGNWEVDDAAAGHSYRIRYQKPGYRLSPASETTEELAADRTDLRAVGTKDDTPWVTGTDADFTYNILNGSFISITKYKGTKTILEIPETIDGYTVQKIGEAFRNNRSIQKVKLPDTVVSIEANAFWGCSALTLAELSPGITSIGDHAFSDCSLLSGLELPNGLKTLGAYAFSGCAGLTDLDFPESLTTIGYRAFYNCTGLSTIAYPVGFTTATGFSESSRYNYGGIFGGCTSLKSVTIPDEITSLPDHAFQGCNCIEEIDLPDSLTAIPDYCFFDCRALKGLTIPSGVKTIGEYALEYCSSVSELTIPSGITEIRREGLADMKALTEITFEGNGLALIGSYAFRNCTGLNSIDLPDSVGTITYRAFYNCTNLQNFDYPTGWTEVGGFSTTSTYEYGSIFEGCTALKSITVPEGVTSIPAYAFKNCSSLEEIHLPAGLTSLSNQMCFGCPELEGLTIPSTVTVIGEYALYGCSEIPELTVPSSVQEIGAYALSHMGGLRKLTFEGAGLKTVGGYAFSGDSGLSAVILPDSVEDISYRAFYNCTNLSSFHYPKGLTKSTQYRESSGWKYGKIFEGCTKLRSLDIPEGTAKIPAELFSGCIHLKNVIFPSTPVTVGTNAFRGCEGIVNLFLAGDGTSVGQSAFEQDSNIKTVNMREGVSAIGARAFANDTRLEHVFIPRSVNAIADDAFTGCDRMLIHCALNSYASIYAVDHGLNFITDLGGEDDASVIDPSASFLRVSVSNAAAKGYIELHTGYRLRQEIASEVTDMSLLVKIPENTTLIENSVTLNGTMIGNYSRAGDILTVGVAESEGELRFSVRPEADIQYYTYASFGYKKNGSAGYEVIGTSTDYIATATILADEDQLHDTFDITGIAPADSIVTVYVDGKANTVTQAGKTGKYLATVKLPDPIEYAPYEISISAKDQSGIAHTAKTNCWYMPGSVELQGFDMYYSSHSQEKMDLLDRSKHGSTLSYNPNFPFTFVMDFSNPEKIENVRVQSDKNGEIRTIDANFDEVSGNWVATGWFGNHYYVPGYLSVTYDMKENATGTPVQDVDFSNPAIIKAYRDVFGVHTVSERTYRDEYGNLTTEYSTEHVNAVWEDVVGVKGLKVYTKIMDQVSKLDKLPWTDTNYAKIFDIYEDYQRFIDQGSDKYWLSVIDNVFTDPNDRTVGNFLVLIGDVSKNDVTALLVEGCVDGEAIVKDLNFVGTTLKTIGKICGIRADYQELYEKISLNQTLSAEQQKSLLAELSMYRDFYTAYSVISAVSGIICKSLGPQAMIIYLAADLFAQKVFDFWKEQILLGQGFFTWLIDPSGYVYEAVVTNRKKGAKATVYFKNGQGGAVPWNAADYLQENPLYTNEEGAYAWDVLEGEWCVKIELEGYDTVTTDWLPVPPVQTDINIGLVSKAELSVEAVYAFAEGVRLIFSQYTDPSTMEGIALLDDRNANVAYTLEYTGEYSATGKELAREYTLKPDSPMASGKGLKLMIPASVTSYTGRTLPAAVEKTASVSEAPSFTMTDTLNLRTGDTAVISGKIENCLPGMTIKADTELHSVAQVEEISQPDANGAFKITLSGISIGETGLITEISGLGISKTTAVITGANADEEFLVRKVILPRDEITLLVGNRKEIVPRMSHGDMTGSWSILEGETFVSMEGNTVAALSEGEAVIRFTCTEYADVYADLTVHIRTSEAMDIGDVLPGDIPEDGEIPEGVWAAAVKDPESDDGFYHYTGSAIRPAIRVYDHTKLLSEGKDYTLKYKNNTASYMLTETDPGFYGKKKKTSSPAVTVTGKGNYEKTMTVYFRIAPASLEKDDGSVHVSDYAAAYNGKEQKPAPEVVWNGKKLKAGTDYKVKYLRRIGEDTYAPEDVSVKPEGTYLVRITGNKNFSGTREVTVTVTEKKNASGLVGKLKVSAVKDQRYRDGEEIKPSLTVKQGSKKLIARSEDPSEEAYTEYDYEVTYLNNRKVGTAYALLRGNPEKGFYGTRLVPFRIVGTSLKKAVLRGIPSGGYEYTGDAVTLDELIAEGTVTLTAKNGTAPLIPYNEADGTGDFRISYKKNVNAGKATVIFTGVNGYTDSVSKTFKIMPVNINDTSVSIVCKTGENGEVPYAKGGAKPEITVTFNGEMLKEGTDYTVNCRNHTRVGNTASVIVKGKGNFGGQLSDPETYIVGKQRLSLLTIRAEDKVYSGKVNAHAAKLTITDLNGKKLKAGTDYDRIFTYRYAEDCTVTQKAGKKETVEVPRTSGEGVDPKDIIPADTRILVTVTGKGAYAAEECDNTLTAEYRIVQKSLSGAKIKVNKKAYTGSEVTLTEDDITVKIKGKKVPAVEIINGEEVRNWSIDDSSYRNNVNKGKASVLIVGEGSFGGSATASFTIGARGIFG